MRTRRIAAMTLGFGLAMSWMLARTFRRFAIRESSMAPTLDAGDWVIARKRRGGVDRGAIVIFTDPTEPTRNLVKRVIGLPGEQVGIERGRVTIGGALLADRWASSMSGPDGTWSIPSGHVWVLGDNRRESASDGRRLGPTPLADIEWIVIGRYHPTARIGTVS